MLNLPENILESCKPLFDAHPLNHSMAHLKGSHPCHTALIEEILQRPALLSRPDLAAGLWLYVDNLEKSHTASQSLETSTGSFWHGIMHRREGDYSNSRYWFRKAADHPLLQKYPDLNPDEFVGKSAVARGEDIPSLVELQRREWKLLFEWCAAQPETR